MIDTALVREAWLTAHPDSAAEFDHWLDNIISSYFMEGYREGLGDGRGAGNE